MLLFVPQIFLIQLPSKIMSLFNVLAGPLLRNIVAGAQAFTRGQLRSCLVLIVYDCPIVFTPLPNPSTGNSARLPKSVSQARLAATADFLDESLVVSGPGKTADAVMS